MKNKHIFFCLIFALVSFNNLIASPNDTICKSKHFFAFEAGIQNRRYFGNNYFNPYFDTIFDREHIPFYDIYGFSYKNNISWHFGFLYYYKLTKHLKLNSGIEVVNRKIILQSNPDTVIKYQIPHNAYKYLYNEICFEIPIFIEFSIKKINFDLGGGFNVLSKNHKISYCLDGSEKNMHFTLWFKKIFYPAIKCSYELSISKQFNMRLYFGIDRFLGWTEKIGTRTYDFKTGISLNL